MNEPTDSLPDTATVVLIDRRRPDIDAAIATVDANFVHHNGERDIWPLRTTGVHAATIALIRTGGAA